MMSQNVATEADSNNPSGLFRYRFDGVLFDEAQSQLWLNATPVEVERLPLQVLAMLLRRPGEVVTRHELLRTVWLNRMPVENVVANAISKLRRALGETASARLVNIPRVGYRFNGPVERMAVGRAPRRNPIQLAAGLPVPSREHFFLSRQLGGDAASAVWLAIDKRLKREIVFKFASSGDQLAALKREFTTHRLLVEELGKRPDLVEVVDSNLAEAPFFLAYDYAGVDLRKWADLTRFDGLARATRLAIFLAIARAVDAAHSVGVLHRDLKPSNVLVEDSPQPVSGPGERELQRTRDAVPRIRLIDFGSSHLLAPQRLAALGVTAMGLTVTDGMHPMLGLTPSYVAPEVAAGQAPTTRSDLYALGLMLYQLLVGDLQRPLTTGWEAELDDPLLVDDVRAATEGRPERRLAGVAQLIERLESLDQRRSAQARAAEAAQQMRAAADRLDRIRARRPWMIALAASLCVTAIGAVGFGAHARLLQRQAEQASARTRAINDFLNLDVLQSPDPARFATNRNQSMFDVLVRASDRAAERFKDDHPVLAQVRRQLGDIYLRMAFADQAEYQYQRVVVVLEPYGRADDADLLAARFGLAETLVDRDHPEIALAALEAAERTASPAALAGSTALAQRALRARVRVLLDAGRYRDALPYARRLLQATDGALPDETDLALRIEARQLLLEIEIHLADASGVKRLEAELSGPPFNRGDIAESTVVSAGLASARDDFRAGRLDAAEAALVALRAASNRVLARNQLLRCMLQQRLAQVHDRQGRFDASLREAGVALDACRAALGEPHQLVTAANIDVAIAELNLGRSAAALAHLETTRRRLDANVRSREQRARLDLARARALTDLGRPDEAIKVLRDLNPVDPGPGIAARNTADLRVQAELGRALIAHSALETGSATLRDALAGMNKAALPAWELERYASLLEKLPSRKRAPESAADITAALGAAPSHVGTVHSSEPSGGLAARLRSGAPN
jgi:non-specific serine/threonine protein kinase